MADQAKTKEQIEKERLATIEARRSAVSKAMNPETYGIRPGGMKNPADVRDAMIRLRSQGVNLLGDERHLDVIPPSYVVSFRFLMIDPYVPEMRGMEGKRTNGYWYEQKGGGLSLTFVSLNQIAHLAGLKWLEFDRADDGRTPLYWRYYGRATVRYFDGTIVTEPGTGEADLRDGSAEIAGMSDKQVAGMRAKGSQRGESIAKAGLIRKMLAIRGVYQWNEAEMPFVWPAMVYIPPTDDVELNRALAMHELGLAADLYGPGTRRTIIDTTVHEAHEPRRLPAPPLVPDIVSQAAQERQRETVTRGAPPSTSDAATVAGERGRGQRPADAGGDGFHDEPIDEPPPWEKKKADAATTQAAPDPWAPHKLDDLVSYCAASEWPDPRKMSDADRDEFLRYLDGDGKKDLVSFLRSGA